MVVASVFLDSFTDFLARINAKKENKAFLTTKDGYYLSHPDLSKIWEPNSKTNSNIKQDYPKEIAQRILAGQQGNIYEDIEKIISFNTINSGQNNQIVVVYELPKYSVFYPVSTFKKIAVGIILLSLGIVLVIGVSIIRRLSRSQTTLYEHAQTAAATAEAKAHQLEQTLNELHRTQTQLVQTEKMSSLGQLVAGVAHEINNPVNFIYGNLTHVNEYSHGILSLMQLYQRHYQNPVPEIQEKAMAIDLDFVMEDLPKILESMKIGTDRIRQIVLSLRNFSRLDESEMKAVDLHEGLESTLLILQNRLKAHADHPGIEVIKDYGELPMVECYAGQLNQVFMNILANAIDAMEEMRDHKDWNIENGKWGDRSPLPQPQIHLHTEVVAPDRVRICIRDNGPGIPAATRERLFEPFFTTKPLGKGTGLGLSISHQIIAEKHGGILACDSEPGKGTEFRIEIPIYHTLPVLKANCYSF
jgi:signal transduction histidine kinase